MAKIKISSRVKDFSEIINQLDLLDDFKNNAVFNVEVEIEDSKSNFTKLNDLQGCGKLLDWDFSKNEGLEIEGLPTESLGEVDELSNDYHRLHEVVNILCSDGKFKELNLHVALLNLIKFCWELSKKSPGYKLTPNLIQEKLQDEFDIFSVVLSTELDLIDRLTEYYSDYSMKPVLEHSLRYIYKSWGKELNKCVNLSEVLDLIMW